MTEPKFTVGQSVMFIGYPGKGGIVLESIYYEDTGYSYDIKYNETYNGSTSGWWPESTLEAA